MINDEFSKSGCLELFKSPEQAEESILGKGWIDAVG